MLAYFIYNKQKLTQYTQQSLNLTALTTFVNLDRVGDNQNPLSYLGAYIYIFFSNVGILYIQQTETYSIHTTIIKSYGINNVCQFS